MAYEFTYASQCPKEIWILVLVDGENLTTRGNYLHLKDLVRTEAVMGAQDGMAAGTAMAHDADAPGGATDNDLTVLSGLEIGSVRVGASTNGKGVALDCGATAI